MLLGFKTLAENMCTFRTTRFLSAERQPSPSQDRNHIRFGDIGGSFERWSNENYRLSRAVQALFALVEALSKAPLTCVPEPPAEAEPQAVALAGSATTG
jgi:hypothetical protein